jgi:hypothetical protein
VAVTLGLVALTGAATAEPYRDRRVTDDRDFARPVAVPRHLRQMVAATGREPTEEAARFEAIQRWREKVTHLYGPEFSRFRFARAKSISCHVGYNQGRPYERRFVGVHHVCEVSGIPSRGWWQRFSWY